MLVLQARLKKILVRSHRIVGNLTKRGVLGAVMSHLGAVPSLKRKETSSKEKKETLQRGTFMKIHFY